MENFLIFEEKSHSSDNTKILQKKSRPTDSVLQVHVIGNTQFFWPNKAQFGWCN